MAVSLGVPTPAFSSALAFYDGYRSGWLPANLLQVSETCLIQTYILYIPFFPFLGPLDLLPWRVVGLSVSQHL